MPSRSSVDPISFHPWQRRERRRAIAGLVRALDVTANGIVVGQHEGDHPEPIPLAISFPMSSTAKPLKNPQESCTDEGDRRRLPQLRPPSSISDSIHSACWPVCSTVIDPEFFAVAEPIPESLTPFKLRRRMGNPESCRRLHHCRRRFPPSLVTS